MKKERNEAICRLYREGQTMVSLCKLFSISEARVGQILKRAGVAKQSRRSDRNKFLGIEITEPMKKALVDEAKRRGVSMSRMSSDGLREMLRACGYAL